MKRPSERAELPPLGAMTIFAPVIVAVNEVVARPVIAVPPLPGGHALVARSWVGEGELVASPGLVHDLADALGREPVVIGGQGRLGSGIEGAFDAEQLHRAVGRVAQ